MIILLQGWHIWQLWLWICCYDHDYDDDFVVTRITHLTTDDNHYMVSKITRDTFGPRRWFSPVSDIVESLIPARLTSKFVFISWQKIIQMEISPMLKPTSVTWESIFKKESPIAMPCKRNGHWYDCSWNCWNIEHTSSRATPRIFSPTWSFLFQTCPVIIEQHPHRPWFQFTIEIIPQDIIYSKHRIE